MNLEALIQSGFLFKVAAAIVELVIGFSLGPFAARLIRHVKGKNIDPGVLTFTGSLVNNLIKIVAILVALSQIGVDISVAVGALSALGLGISLALKDNMANVAGGMQILLTKPFKVGDYISCDDGEGTVMVIDMMFTQLQTFDMQEVIIPNASLVSSTITNYSGYPNRRIVVKVPISCFADDSQFRKEIVEKIKTQPLILSDPAPTTVVSGFTESGNGMYVNVVCYTTIDEYWDMLFWVNEQIQQLRIQLELPIPQNSVKVSS